MNVNCICLLCGLLVGNTIIYHWAKAKRFFCYKALDKQWLTTLITNEITVSCGTSAVKRFSADAVRDICIKNKSSESSDLTDLRSFKLAGHLGIVITQLSKRLPAEEVELCCLDKPVHAVTVQVRLEDAKRTGHMGKLFCRVGLLEEKDGVAAVATGVRLPVGVTADQALLGCEGQVAEESEAQPLGVGLIHGASGVFEHMLVERAVFGTGEQKMRVVLVAPHDPRGHVLVFLEGGEGNERPANVPHVDVVVHHHGAGGQMKLPLGTPLDSRH